MSHKSGKIAAMIQRFQGHSLDAHYLGFFECFNQGLFFESHDVLEELWLAQGKVGSNYGFYKGLIQLAGAFVHLQKNRLRPAAALFGLARTNLVPYSAIHECLDLAEVRAMIEWWMGELEAGGFARNPLTAGNAPKLFLSAPRLAVGASVSIS